MYEKTRLRRANPEWRRKQCQYCANGCAQAVGPIYGPRRMPPFFASNNGGPIPKSWQKLLTRSLPRGGLCWANWPLKQKKLGDRTGTRRTRRLCGHLAANPANQKNCPALPCPYEQTWARQTKIMLPFFLRVSCYMARSRPLCISAYGGGPT